MNRRSLLAALPMTAALASSAGDPAQAAGAEGASPMPPPKPDEMPTLEYVYGCDVALGPVQEGGAYLPGRQRIIPITGGRFEGPNIRGEVIPGGADWNLSRSDGAGQAEAVYFLKTDDGALIHVHNQGVNGPAAPGTPPIRMFGVTTPVFQAPLGKYEWLNRGTYVGTFGTRGVPNAVFIRVYRAV